MLGIALPLPPQPLFLPKKPDLPPSLLRPRDHRWTMVKPVVVYFLIATAFLFLLTFSRTPDSGPRRRTSRRLAHNHRITFDPKVEQLERQAEERGLLDLRTFQEMLDKVFANKNLDEFPEEIGILEEYFGEEGRLNITERLMYLFPLLDRFPKDGGISFEELERWNQRQVMDRLVYDTEMRMKEHDKDRNGAVTLKEFLSYAADDEMGWNDMEHGKGGWWKERFVIADEDGNGSLDVTEFNNFLHPEDSGKPKFEMWLQKEKMREMDQDKDGKLSLTEFRERANNIYSNYEDDEAQNLMPNPEEKFEELDVNNDKFLTVEELKPIIHRLYPGELDHVTRVTRFLMHEADTDRDGKLTLEEMFQHQYAFYSTVVEEGRYDEDDYDFSDELR